jgi:RimJ/RimL family protein N-acetyltransferase
VREITVQDAAAFLDLCLALDQETEFMMLEPGERPSDMAWQERRIQSWLAEANETVLVCAVENELAGFIAVAGGKYRRNRHSAHLVLGVRQKFASQGFGRQLMSAAENWARRQGMHRLELTVMTHNQRAVGLYRKMGYEIEGVRHDSLRVSGTFVDEYAMAKLLAG